MTVVNDSVAIERILWPNELHRLRIEYPSLIELLKNQQVLITQVINRTGGSGEAVNVIVVTGNHTTSGNEFLSCSGTLTITLNATPEDEESVVVNHRGANTDVLTIFDGVAYDKLLVTDTVISYTYIDSLARWVRGA